MTQWLSIFLRTTWFYVYRIKKFKRFLESIRFKKKQKQKKNVLARPTVRETLTWRRVRTKNGRQLWTTEFDGFRDRATYETVPEMRNSGNTCWIFYQNPSVICSKYHRTATYMIRTNLYQILCTCVWTGFYLSDFDETFFFLNVSQTTPAMLYIQRSIFWND